MRREFFLLPNANETQRSSATLSGMSGRQKEKGASSGRRQMQKIVFGNSFGDAGSEGILHTALCYKKAVRNSSLLRTNPDRQTALWIYLFRTYILTVQRKQLSCWSCNHSHYVHMESVSLLTSILANRCDVFGGIRVFLICSVASELPLVTTLLPFAFTIPLLSASDYSEVHLLLQKSALDIFAVKFSMFIVT